MVRGPRISADLSGSGAAPIGSGAVDLERLPSDLAPVPADLGGRIVGS